MTNMDRQETIKLLDDYMSALNTKKENGARIKKLKMDMGITYDPNDGYSLIKFLYPSTVPVSSSRKFFRSANSFINASRPL